MTELEIATLLNRIREIIREELAPLINNKGLMNIQQASKYLSIGSGKLRELCKSGLDGAVQTGGTVHRYYRVDVIKAKNDLEKRGIYRLKSKNR